MKNLKIKYAEKSLKESHSYIFNNLEIKNFIQNFLLNKYGLSLNNYNIYFSNSTININISIYNIAKLKTNHPLKKKKLKNLKVIAQLLLNTATLKQTALQTPYILLQEKDDKNALIKTEFNFIKNKKNNFLKITGPSTKNSWILFVKKQKFPEIGFEYYKIDNNNRIIEILKTKPNLKNINELITKIRNKKCNNSNLCKKSILKFYSQNLKENITENLLESLHSFLKNKYKIKLTIFILKNISESHYKEKFKIMAEKRFRIETLENILKLKLRRFERNQFFKYGTLMLFNFTSQLNSEKLFTHFISKEMKFTKQHKIFLNFIKEGLQTMMKQNFSKISGIKLVIKGRLNNAMRAKSYTIKIGKISLIQPNFNINYSETTSYEKNGTLGIKLWVLRKT